MICWLNVTNLDKENVKEIIFFLGSPASPQVHVLKQGRIVHRSG